jgi:hypothetical protein
MVILSDAQAQTLRFYILATTQHRKNEQEACESLGNEIDNQGQPQFPNMVANAKWWKETEDKLQEISKILDGKSDA